MSLFKKKEIDPKLIEDAERTSEELGNLIIENENRSSDTHTFEPDSDAAPVIKVSKGTTKEPLLDISQYNLRDKKDAMKLVKRNGVFVAALPGVYKKDVDLLAVAVANDRFAIVQVPENLKNNPKIQQAFSQHKEVQLYKKGKLDPETAHILELMEQERELELKDKTNQTPSQKADPKAALEELMKEVTSSPAINNSKEELQEVNKGEGQIG